MRSTVLITILLIISLALPAAAFSADRFTLTIEENGDAEIQFDYTLTWIERVAVYLRIAEPEKELKHALERNYNRPVEIKEVTSGSVQFTVDRLAQTRYTHEGTVYTVPVLDFSSAVTALENYWFAPLVKVDLAPEIATVTFPDNTTEEFGNVTIIPELVHTIK
ncbi:hypothetical protein J2T58_001273 [Methanocalculus alkaliphilus]|uniref:hypothetical protein n=1 Tax=Methanocalculus alkaliphilus TaxID=768730 RepID=UPI00209EF903|nr:hypothetical protein [Methanocalculus alkaliphilus]MCP1715415.1 hypothetical protein [Methanocalculus alkaliphilus]